MTLITRVKDQPSHVGGVASIAVSSTQPSSFVSVGSSDGVVRLWDLRVQRRPDLLSISLPGGLLDDAEVVHYRSGEDRTACVAAGNRLVFLDFRNPTEAQSIVEYTSNVLAMGVVDVDLPSNPASHAAPFVIAAEDSGELHTTWWPSAAAKGQSNTTTTFSGGPPPYFCLPSADPPRNVCVGFGTTSTVPLAATPSTMTLWSAYMDGRLLGFRPARGDDVSSSCPTMKQKELKDGGSHSDAWTVVYDTNISTWNNKPGAATSTGASVKTARLCNPPLPTSLSCVQDYVCVGTASGEYSIFQTIEPHTETDGGDGENVNRNALLLELALSAPGHESVGLVAAELMPSSHCYCPPGSQLQKKGDAINMHLLTVAISGEITLWDVGPLLAPVVVGDDEGEGAAAAVAALPEVLFADSLRNNLHRDAQRCVVNCVAHSSAKTGPSSLWVGDSHGYVYCGLLALS